MNGIVYVGSFDKKLYAFNATCQQNCQPLWSYQTSGSIESSATLANKLLYIGSDDGKVYIFDATSTTAKQPLSILAPKPLVPRPVHGITSTLFISAGKLYIHTENGDVYAYGFFN